MSEAADKAARAQDDHITNPALEVGDRVLLKRNAFTERHKLEDKFYEIPYVIVEKNDENDLFKIRPAMGGVPKWVNRRRLILDPRAEVNELDEVLPDDGRDDIDNDHENDVEESDSSSDEDDDSSDDDDQNDFQWIFEEAQATVNKDIPGPRRSSRSSKGAHSNPHHLPRSCVS